MMPIHALLIGQGSSPSPERGVLARRWRSLDVALPSALLSRPLEAARLGLVEFDMAPLVWADVLVLRTWYATAAACLACDVASLEEAVLLEHSALSGHEWRRPHEVLVRALVEALDRQPTLLRGRGLVYELDDDPWAVAGGAAHPGLALELDLVRLLLRSADVVVAATPEAAEAARREGTHPEALVLATLDDEAARSVAWHRAATRAGSGRLLSARASAAMVAEVIDRSTRLVDHRQRLRGLDEAFAARLGERHAAGLPCWDEADAVDPLVSVVIPTVDEPAEVIERAIRSALDGEGVRIEVVVAGGPGSDAADAVDLVDDARVRFVAVTALLAADAPESGSDAWRAAAWAMATDAANEAALGAWIAPLDPRSVFVPGHIGLLLEIAIEHGLELVYGQTVLVQAGEVAGQVGAWPPAPESLAHDAALLAANLRSIRPDAESSRDDEDPAWNLWRRCIEVGARIANVEEPVTLRDASAFPSSGAATVGDVA
jgi:hypothetical protein